ncbi:MAG: pitrilysin family protein [Thermodesulfobacteriota bacterium]|nr:pitrilysin family protein [Thermodesulfobacteriota bacterium]
MRYEKTVLNNGVRVVTNALPNAKSISLGIWVDGGSRDEVNKERGIFHFIEHMIFKGTKDRSAVQIAKDLDALGGYSNAFTSKEKTCFHARVVDKKLQFLTELFSDIFLYSIFDEKEMELEKSVVLQEINMVEDTPDEYVQTLFEQNFWEKNPLGRPILGTREAVSKISRKDIIDYISRFYSPERVVIAAAGNVDHDDLVEYFRPFFDPLSRSDDVIPVRSKPLATPSISTHPKDLEQVHICLGAQASSMSDKERFADSILNTILGGNMSSRLFQEIREKRGLAYSVFSYISSFMDTGSARVYLATDKEKVNKSMDLVGSIIKKIKEGDISDTDLTRAKGYLEDGILLGSEDMDNIMMRLAKNEFVFGKYVTYEELIKEIEDVTTSEVIEAAGRIFSSGNVSLSALGPIDQDSLIVDPINFT